MHARQGGFLRLPLLPVQPDALAQGKDADTLRAEGVPEHLVPHKTFTGGRQALEQMAA